MSIGKVRSYSASRWMPASGFVTSAGVRRGRTRPPHPKPTPPPTRHRVGKRKRPVALAPEPPITTLANRADPDGAEILWDNSNIVESYGGVTTPLTYSFARTRMPRSIANLQGAGRTRNHHRRQWRGLRPHGRADSRAHLLQPDQLVSGVGDASRLSHDRRFMEQMMGVRGRAPRGVGG